jgi:hypothetical protein
MDLKENEFNNEAPNILLMLASLERIWVKYVILVILA